MQIMMNFCITKFYELHLSVVLYKVRRHAWFMSKK